MVSYIVLLGPPGVGKGTQAEILAREISLPHISSGDLFRENMKNDTDLGKQARSIWTSGELVPDDLTIAMVEDRLSRRTAGPAPSWTAFPGRQIQAEALQRHARQVSADVDWCRYIAAAPDGSDSSGPRGGGRAGPTATFIMRAFSPPKVERQVRYRRIGSYSSGADDTAETVARRIQVYLEQTTPLVEYYRAQHKLVEIDGTQSIEEVTKLSAGCDREASA